MYVRSVLGCSGSVDSTYDFGYKAMCYWELHQVVYTAGETCFEGDLAQQLAFAIIMPLPKSVGLQD